MTISRLFYRSFLLCALLFAAASAGAQIQVCVDANGNKTFAQECPPNTLKQKELENPGVPGTGGSATSDDKLRKANQDFDKRRADRQKQQADADKREADARHAEQTCSDARARLAVLQSGRPARRVDPVTGEHIPDDDAQIQAEIDGLNAQVAQNCK